MCFFPMKIKHVGYLLIGLAIIMLIIVLLFKQSLAAYLYEACPLLQDPATTECPATKTLNQQSYLAFSLVAIIALIGVILTIVKPEQKIVVKTITPKPQKQKPIDTIDLSKEERQILELIQKEKAIFQADLIEKTQLNKAKVTRLLDRLQNRSLIERKRRGLTNVVVFKEKL